MAAIKIATANNIEKIIPAFMELRPHRSKQDFRELFPLLFKEGYQVAYIGNDEIAYSVIGFRMMTFLFSGKTLYIDDLSTLSNHKNKGYAGKLFEWTKQYAKDNNCEHLSLDSGLIRRDAHRLYLNKGLFVESLHFGRKVEEL
jgi:GNAT superfamily N-acetyltransferase